MAGIKKYIVLDKNFQIQETFNTKESAMNYAKENVKYQPQIVASIQIIKKMV